MAMVVAAKQASNMVCNNKQDFAYHKSLETNYLGNIDTVVKQNLS